MKILVLGDIHGKWKALEKTIYSARRMHDITHIIQVGDFGHGWPTGGKLDLWKKPKTLKNIPFYFLDGNHENFTFLETYKSDEIIYMPRGATLTIDNKKLLFIGGASSIDKQYRIPFLSWWPQESITSENIRTASRVGKVDAVFSHDKPDDVIYKPYAVNYRCGLADRLALSVICSEVKPEFWFYGHYHHPDSTIQSIDGKETAFTCCPEIRSSLPPWYCVWDGKTVWNSWDNIKSHNRKIGYL